MNAEPNITTLSGHKTIGAGSIVTLKSGGPNMTVAERSSEKAHCLWHADSGELCSFWFPLGVLTVRL